MAGGEENANRADGRADIDRQEKAGPRLFSIPPGAPFLQTLSEALIHGRLIPGYVPVEKPEILADATIYLPTRRAARALGLALFEALRDATGRQSSFLPRIRTIGDVDEEEHVLALRTHDVLASGEVIGDVERLMMLAPLARRFAETLHPEHRGLLGEESIVLPSSAADAIRLAGAMARFIDSMNIEEASWQDIFDHDAGNANAWWQLTLTFLSILMEKWPEALAEAGFEDPSTARRKLIDARARQIREAGGNGPVIAAGSTGSIPATARLLSAIASHEKGAVVLPGYDTGLDSGVLHELASGPEMKDGAVLSTHPQYGMVRLLRSISAGSAEKTAGTHGQVEELGGQPEATVLRNKGLQAALLPARHTGSWRITRNAMQDSKLEDAFSGVAIVEAGNDRQEATAIAIALREALDTEGKTAALVTPDRNLARRVAGELQRFGIDIDDTGGQPLANSGPASFLRLLLSATLQEADPVVLASFIGHRFFLAGHDANEARRLCEHIEIACIRERLPVPGLSGLPASCAALADGNTAGTHDRRQKPDAMTATRMQALVSAAASICEPLTEIADRTDADFCKTLQIAGEIAQLLATDADGVCHLNDAPGWRELAGILESSLEAGGMTYEIRACDMPACLDALLAGRSFRDLHRTHPRLQIYGQLEARLQHHDLIVLGGLNETVWPQSATNDPFLNRPMRSALDLPLPERRIGQAAHDFCQLAAASEVVFARSIRSAGAPTVASRWLQRLDAFLGKGLSGSMRERGARLVELASRLERHPRTDTGEIRRAEFRPPISARPNSLSFTQIETLIRDPYAIHARKILMLKPLPDLVPRNEAALRGTLYHAIMRDFVEGLETGTDSGSRARLMEIAQRHLQESGLPAHVQLAWLQGFGEVCEPYLAWENSRRPEIAKSYCEINGRVMVGDTGFELTGRADRIDLMRDGQLVIIDYKTGSNPSKGQARSLSPQLSLEAAAAMRGGFGDVPAAGISGMLYVRLRGGRSFSIDDLRVDGKVRLDANEIAGNAMENLCKLVDKFRDPETSYISRHAPFKDSEMSGDYDHLARVREWSIAEEDEE